MFKFVVLLTAIASCLAASIPEGMLAQLDGRIVGGAATNIQSYPWQVSLQRNGEHFCGGTIYSTTIIVTSAHCVSGGVTATSLRVRAGSTDWNSGGTLNYVAAIRVHEGFNPTTMTNDIALIRLSSSLWFTTLIKSIALALSDPPNGAAAVVTGWGLTTYGAYGIPKNLQYVDVKIIGRSQCTSTSYGYTNKIDSSMICAAATNKDACTGDSGGPLVSGGVLVGVVSWGYGCANGYYPGVYADVANLRSWVINNVNKVY